MIISDWLKRKRIAAAGTQIAESFVTARPNSTKGKRRQAAARGALVQIDNAARAASKELGLGFFGKARLCKSIQDALLESDLPEDEVTELISSLAERVAVW